MEACPSCEERRRELKGELQRKMQSASTLEAGAEEDSRDEEHREQQATTSVRKDEREKTCGEDDIKEEIKDGGKDKNVEIQQD